MSKFMNALLVARKADEVREKEAKNAADRSLKKRVTDEQIKKIIELDIAEVKRAQIAQRTQINAHTIYNILRRYSLVDGKVVLNERD